MNDVLAHLKCPHCGVPSSIHLSYTSDTGVREGTHLCRAEPGGCGKRFYFRVEFTYSAMVSKLDFETVASHVSFGKVEGERQANGV